MVQNSWTRLEILSRMFSETAVTPFQFFCVFCEFFGHGVTKPFDPHSQSQGFYSLWNDDTSATRASRYRKARVYLSGEPGFTGQENASPQRCGNGEGVVKYCMTRVGMVYRAAYCKGVYRFTCCIYIRPPHNCNCSQRDDMDALGSQATLTKHPTCSWGCRRFDWRGPQYLFAVGRAR